MTRRRTTTSPAPHRIRALTGGAAALVALVALAGSPLVASSATVAPPVLAHRVSTTPTARVDFTLKGLAGLRDYSFTYHYATPSQGLAAVGEVHDPTDWRLTVSVASRGPSVTTYDVGGHGYSLVTGLSVVSRVTFASPEGLTHLNGEETWARALLRARRVPGVRQTTVGPCRVAGERGTLYDLRSPTTSQGVFAIADRACVGRGGPLLSFTEGVTGGSAAGAIGLAGKSETFAVTSIGRVGVIRAPPGSAASPPATTPPPTPSSVSGRLPAGFPSAVPAPPGSIMSAARLSATKWYVLLTESSAHALSTYVSHLETKGFTVSTRTTTAASTIVTLGDASFRLVLEEMSLPGEGVTLAVTVGRA